MPSRNRAHDSRADGDAREMTKPTTTRATIASATSASSAYPVLMTPEDVTTAICRGRARSALGLDLFQSLFDALDSGGGAHRRGLIAGGHAGRGGEDVRVADDVLGHLVVRVAELGGDLTPREVGQVGWRVTRAVQAEDPTDVDERELPGLL